MEHIAWSKTWTFFEGEWREGNIPIMGPRTQRGCVQLCSMALALSKVSRRISISTAPVSTTPQQSYS